MPRPPKKISLRPDYLAKEQDYYTAKEASKFLGVSLRMFRKYTAAGYLSGISIGKNIYYKRDDLIGMRDNKEPNVEFSPRSFAILQGKVSRLANRLEMIERILDLRYEPLELDDLQLHALYLAAKERKIQTNTKTIQYWGEVLVRLTEAHFLQLSKFTKDSYCWRPFLEMAFLCYGIAKLKDFWALRKLLNLAYKNIRQSVNIYLELYGVRHMTRFINTGQLKKELAELRKKTEIQKLLKEEVLTEGIEREVV